MRSITNLAWPSEPFGAGQRPFGHDRPILAAIGTGWNGTDDVRTVPRPRWGCAVYLTIPSTSTLSLDGHQLSFGFEILSADPDDDPAAFATRMDERLIACRRRARILAGHALRRDLDSLDRTAAAHRLRGVQGVRQQWIDRAAKGRGMARMIDTAHDLAAPGGANASAPVPTSIAAVAADADLTGLDIDVSDTARNSKTDSDIEPGLAATVRQALTRTLAVALVAARHVDRYAWTQPIALDELVTGAAWDLLAELGESPTTGLHDTGR